MKVLQRILAEVKALSILLGECIFELVDALRQGYLAKLWHETYYGIDINGGFDFVHKTKHSLKLLRTTPYFKIVTMNIKVIKETRRSTRRNKAVMYPNRFKPTCSVGYDIWNKSVIYYASVIAHEAYHGHLYSIAVSRSRLKMALPSSWAGVEAERLCYKFQLEVLQHFKADSTTCAAISKRIDHLPSFYYERGFARWIM